MHVDRTYWYNELPHSNLHILEVVVVVVVAVVAVVAVVVTVGEN